MSGHVSHMEWVTDVGGGLSGRGDVWRWGSLDVSSVRCNNHVRCYSSMGNMFVV